MIQENTDREHPLRGDQAAEWAEAWDEVQAELQEELQSADMEKEPGEARVEIPARTNGPCIVLTFK
jgi:hypothetical protein